MRSPPFRVGGSVCVGRPVTARLPTRAVFYALLGNIVVWLLYGAAFQLFVRGLLGSAAGGYAEYLAAYTISYLVGYLFLFAPAGIGAREDLAPSADDGRGQPSRGSLRAAQP